MWIHQLQNGKFKFRDTYKNPLTGKWNEVSCTFGKNNNAVRKQAQMILDEKIKRKLQELQSGVTTITFLDRKSVV